MWTNIFFFFTDEHKVFRVNYFLKSSIVHSPNLSKNDICPSATLDWMFGKWNKDDGVLIAILIETIIILENLSVNTSLLGMVVVRVDPDADEGKASLNKIF